MLPGSGEGTRGRKQSENYHVSSVTDIPGVVLKALVRTQEWEVRTVLMVWIALEKVEVSV